LAAVLHGRAAPSLLASYEAERRPVAVHNVALSLRNYRRVLDVTRTLGLDANHLSTFQWAVSGLPTTLQKAALGGALWLARTPLGTLSESNPLWAGRLRQAREMFATGRSLALLYPKQDLGVCYREGCLIPSPPGHPDTASGSPKDHQEYIPSAAPGHRFPHFWVESHGRRLSILDLLGGLEWTLVVDGARGAAATWATTVDRLNATQTTPLLRCLAVNGPSLRIPADAGPTDWGAVCPAIGPGAVLVRPDGHVAAALPLPNDDVPALCSLLEATLIRLRLIPSR